MAVRFTAAHSVYQNHMVHRFAAGDELPGGELANYLLAGGAPVEEIEAAPAVDAEQDPGGDGQESGNDQDPDGDEQGDEPDLVIPDGSIATVLLWVGTDNDKAAAALAAERDKGDGARVGLVSALEKQLAATSTPTE